MEYNHSTIRQNIGDRITERRKQMGYNSQSDFVKALYPDTVDESKPLESKRKKISYWESGKHEPNIEDLLLLCKVLDCDTDYLLGKIDTPHKATADIVSTTGLSEEAVNVLMGMKKAKDSKPISENSPSLKRVPEQEKAKIISRGKAYTDFYNNLLEFISFLIKSREPSEITIQEKDGRIKKKSMAVKLSLVSCEEHIQGYVHASAMADHLRALLTEFPKDDEDAMRRWKEMHPNTDDVNRQAKHQRIREEMERQEEQKLIHLWRGSKLMSDLFERFVKEVESNAAKE